MVSESQTGQRQQRETSKFPVLPSWKVVLSKDYGEELHVLSSIREETFTENCEVEQLSDNLCNGNSCQLTSNIPGRLSKGFKDLETSESSASVSKGDKNPEISKIPGRFPKCTKDSANSESCTSVSKDDTNPECSKIPGRLSKGVKDPQTSESSANVSKDDTIPEIMRTAGRLSKSVRDPETSESSVSVSKDDSNPEISKIPGRLSKSVRDPETSESSVSVSKNDTNPEISKSPGRLYTRVKDPDMCASLSNGDSEIMSNGTERNDLASNTNVIKRENVPANTETTVHELTPSLENYGVDLVNKAYQSSMSIVMNEGTNHLMPSDTKHRQNKYPMDFTRYPDTKDQQAKDNLLRLISPIGIENVAQAYFKSINLLQESQDSIVKCPVNTSIDIKGQKEEIKDLVSSEKNNSCQGEETVHTVEEHSAKIWRLVVKDFARQQAERRTTGNIQRPVSASEKTSSENVNTRPFLKKRSGSLPCIHVKDLVLKGQTKKLTRRGPCMKTKVPSKHILMYKI